MKRPLHVCYCHTPTHFYWRHYDQYLASPGFGIFNPLARLGLKILAGPMRRWDKKAAGRLDFFIANSNHIKADIKKYYGRDSVVIHPPVDVGRFSPQPSTLSPNQLGFVTVGRQVPYKHTDIIIRAANQMKAPLTVVGNGPEHKKLTALAGKTVTFDTNASDADVAKYLAGAKAFIFAAFEDFGVTPVEAMAAGTPVVAYKAGGALDYVVPGKIGEFFDHQTPESLVDALQSLVLDKFDAQTIAEHAKQFSPEVFRTKIQDFINKIIG
jgi:glycosyltransferase involved in cell wall biosynthesis